MCAASNSNAPIEAGYYHSIANIMTNAAIHTGQKQRLMKVKQHNR
jgi:hypothetical protein